MSTLPSLYNLLGSLSAGVVLLSVVGVWAQLQKIYERKKLYTQGELTHEKPTEVLTLNRFVCSFWGFFSMLYYGLTMPDLNLYLVAPRIVATCIVLCILFEIFMDRRSRSSAFAFLLCAICLLIAAALPFTPYRAVSSALGFSQFTVVLAAFLVLQSTIHQIYMIRKNGHTGAVSLRMHQLFALKDIFSLGFGILLGLSSGWPVIFMHVVSLFCQLAVMYHFSWVKNHLDQRT